MKKENKFVCLFCFIYMLKMKKYIVLEWIHWSGKTTVSKKLVDRLRQVWINAVYYHFPDEESLLWQAIRQIVTDKDLVYDWHITWVLYAWFANLFHKKTENDDKIYILDRHSVSTWLIFQREIPWNVRLELYATGIESLKKNWKFFYLTVDKNIAKQRTNLRNKELLKKWWIWATKAKDLFNEEKFDELTKLYDEFLIPELKKLWFTCQKVENNNSIQTTVDQIISYLGL